jgi:hypothetical protein
VYVEVWQPSPSHTDSRIGRAGLLESSRRRQEFQGHLKVKEVASEVATKQLLGLADSVADGVGMDSESRSGLGATSIFAQVGSERYRQPRCDPIVGGQRPHGYVSVIGPHCDGGSWPHLGRFDVGVTELFGPTCDTPGVV